MHETLTRYRLTRFKTSRTVILLAVLCALFFSNAEGTSLLPFPHVSQTAADNFHGEEAPGSYNKTIKAPRSSHAKAAKDLNAGHAGGVPGSVRYAEPRQPFIRAAVSVVERVDIIPASRQLAPNETRGPPAA